MTIVPIVIIFNNNVTTISIISIIIAIIIAIITIIITSITIIIIIITITIITIIINGNTRKMLLQFLTLLKCCSAVPVRACCLSLHSP